MEGVKTGTTTLGIVCKDGVVIAADKRATAGGFIVAKDVDKVVQITDSIVITTAGAVSEIQLFIKLLRAELTLKNIKTNRINTVKEAANISARMVYETARQYFSGVTHFLMAGYDKLGTHLYEISSDGTLLELKDYVSSGSGSPMVYGILEHQYKDTITTKEAEDLAVKAISASMQRDSFTGNGIDVMTVTKDGIKKTVQKKISSVAI
jgi:proteasome beta subunit